MLEQLHWFVIRQSGVKTNLAVWNSVLQNKIFLCVFNSASNTVQNTVLKSFQLGHTLNTS